MSEPFSSVTSGDESSPKNNSVEPMWKLDELMGNWRSSQLILVQRLGGRPSQVHYPSLPLAVFGSAWTQRGLVSPPSWRRRRRDRWRRAREGKKRTVMIQLCLFLSRGSAHALLLSAHVTAAVMELLHLLPSWSFFSPSPPSSPFALRR